MKRGFVLTESEKLRIRKIYNKNIILEQETPAAPTDVEEVKKFMDWMDTNHTDWVTLNNAGKKGNSKKDDGTYRTMYGNPNSPSFKRAWNTWGKDYTNENPPTPVNNDKYIWWSKSKEKSAPMGLDGIQKEIEAGTINKDNFISKKPSGGKWETKKASEYAELDLGPEEPPTPDAPKAPEAPAAPASNNGQPKSDDDSLGNTLSMPKDSGSPFKSTNTFPFDTSGFTSWFKQTYNDEPPTDLSLNDKKGYMLATDGSKQLIYTYNDELKRWNLPTTYNAEQGRSKLVKKQEPKVSPAPAAAEAPTTGEDNLDDNSEPKSDTDNLDN